MTAEITPMNPPPPPDPKCSFCGTPKSKAEKFLSNGEGTKHICGDCVTKAKQRLLNAA